MVADRDGLLLLDISMHCSRELLGTVRLVQHVIGERLEE
jgi:hypothetical protein